MRQDSTITEIDLDSIVRERAGRKARFVPRFVIHALKRHIHQDFINEFLRRGYVGVDFCEQSLKYLDASVEVVGAENLPPADGRRYTFVSNHPLGAIDGLALGMVLGRRYDGKVKYLVNDLLMNLKGLAPLCIPINKIGKQARNFPQMVEDGFRSDNHIIMFPAGLCSRRIDGQIRDLPWKKTFISKSVETRRDVVPIRFEGRNSERFYTVADICSKLRLKVNLAMLLLPDEMYRARHACYRVVIGKPIPWQTFDKSRPAAAWAKYVQEEVYKL